MIRAMDKLATLRNHVETLYTTAGPEADPWIDWGYPHHVLVVGDLAEELARSHQLDVSVVVAGALLHDIADAVTVRRDPEHETKSLQIAADLLAKSGYDETTAQFIVDEIIQPHGCDTQMPTADEGKAVATADGAAHFLTDFYPYFAWQHYGPGTEYAIYKDWALKKIEKDITKKMFYPEIKERVEPAYKVLRQFFSA
jgi:putative nucleotidyltransferase with HDIG domain